MAGELIEVLQQSDLLANRHRQVLGPLAETATTEEYAAGDVVFETGADGDTLYVVRSGVVEIRPGQRRQHHADRPVPLRAGRPGHGDGGRAAGGAGGCRRDVRPAR